ncbi:hypothetical protein RF11_13508 [Thelohanellus kitauei]|uniref:Uncharacterized protein n=1 Tax=Thelohanellus kitauei TaxID=669202 RepID=A0A0C2N1M6_THEKT|nr:hypothetical protein RF11_13508 [Thelohanellus kitauei]
MSEQTQAAQVENKPYQPKSQDLSKKQISIPGIGVYHLIMKQNKDSRFFIIQEVKESVGGNRIIVTMDNCHQFMTKLNDVLMFDSEYSSGASTNTTHKDSGILFNVSMHTEAGRRYYFDVIDKDGVLNLKMSYIYDDRRDSIHIDTGSLVYFIEVVDIFQKEYPSLTGKDDFHGSRNKRFDKRRDYTNRQRRGNYGNSGKSNRPGNRFNNIQSFDESGERKPTHGLKICSDPAPYQFSKNAKKYIFEIVEGDNTFMRITEVVGDSRKSTLHIPISCLKKVGNVILDMNERFSAARSAQ